MFKNAFAFLHKSLAQTGGGDASPDTLKKLRNALGGAGNIVKAEPIAKTRLLVTLKDNNLIDRELAEADGFAIFQPKGGGEVHVLVGLNPERFHALV